MKRTRGLWLAPDVEAELAQGWRRSFWRWFEDDRLRLPGLDSGRLALVDSPLGRLVAKRDGRRGWLVWSGLRAAHGLRAFRVGRALQQHGIPCAEPLAYVQRRGLPPLVDGALISRYVSAPHLWDFLEEKASCEPRLEPMLAALAEGLAQLHGAGFRHRDLKASNLLAQQHGPAALRIVFIDLDGARGPKRIPLRLRQRDLARLAASFLTPRALGLGIESGHWSQLLAAYLEHAKLDPELLPVWEANTARWAAEHNARNEARGRSLS